MNCVKNVYIIAFIEILSFIITLLFSNISLAETSASQAVIQTSGTNWLFVIGINDYLEWPRLQTAVHDAQSVKNVMIDRYNFDKSHIVELYNERATRKNILNSFVSLAERITPDDSLVIFYSGHGHLDPITNTGKWIPVESGVSDVSAWISNDDIQSYLKIDAIKAKHILLISDSCFAGSFFKVVRGIQTPSTDARLRQAYMLTSRQAITSGGLQPVTDEGFSGSSVFAFFMIKYLKENQKPYVLPLDLFNYIIAGVVENFDQEPQYGTLYNTGGQHGGELVLFLKNKYLIHKTASSPKIEAIPKAVETHTPPSDSDLVKTDSRSLYQNRSLIDSNLMEIIPKKSLDKKKSESVELPPSNPAKGEIRTQDCLKEKQEELPAAFHSNSLPPAVLKTTVQPTINKAKITARLNQTSSESQKTKTTRCCELYLKISLGESLSAEEQRIMNNCP